MLRRNLILLFSVPLIISTALGQLPRALNSEDYQIGVLKEGMDSISVKRIMGNSDSVRAIQNPFEEGSELVSWYFPGLVVNFGAQNSVQGFILNIGKYKTRRGLGVGDSIERVTQLYGKPTGIYENEWEYSDSNHELHVIRITVHKSNVRKIFIGWLND